MDERFEVPNPLEYATQIFIDQVVSAFKTKFGLTPHVLNARMVNSHRTVELHLTRCAGDEWFELIELPTQSRAYLHELSYLHSYKTYSGMFKEIAYAYETERELSAARQLLAGWNGDIADLQVVVHPGPHKEVTK